MASKIKERFDNFMMGSKRRKNGFERIRYVFRGTDPASGETLAFFVELYAVNPLNSPKEVVLGFKSRPKLSSADLQYALASADGARVLGAEQMVLPSFVCVSAGILGAGGTRVNQFFHYDGIKRLRKQGALVAGESVFAPGEISGSVSQSEQSVMQAPEFLSAAGEFKWNIRYRKLQAFLPRFSHKEDNWLVDGAQSSFEGTICFNGKEYAVSSAGAQGGYIDRAWGADVGTPWFHLSGSQMNSLISGKRLEGSCFAVQGEYDKKLVLYARLDGRLIRFSAGSRKTLCIWECVQAPHEKEAPKLHWKASFHCGRYIMDVDAYCATDSMSVQDYEVPSGGRKKFSVLAGADGTGELRFYREKKKVPELLEHVAFGNCLCEFGNIELPSR